ncbi:hypothetical protein BJ742DRAFT_816566 [Cladochytrium replicatum]|nr:hypothetical protein BJ742DRAFT_816566 [Cladochytrium replicatum]
MLKTSSCALSAAKKRKCIAVAKSISRSYASSSTTAQKKASGAAQSDRRFSKRLSPSALLNNLAPSPTNTSAATPSSSHRITKGSLPESATIYSLAPLSSRKSEKKWTERDIRDEFPAFWSVKKFPGDIALFEAALDAGNRGEAVVKFRDLVNSPEEVASHLTSAHVERLLELVGSDVQQKRRPSQMNGIWSVVSGELDRKNNEAKEGELEVVDRELTTGKEGEAEAAHEPPINTYFGIKMPPLTVRMFNLWIEHTSDERSARLYMTKMPIHGVEPNMETYRAYLSLLFRKAQMSRIQKFYNQMISENMVPSQEIYDLLISGSIRYGWVDLAKYFVSEMKDHSYAPGPGFYLGLTRKAVSEGNQEEFETLVKEIEDTGIELDGESFASVIEGFCRFDQFEKALSLFELARSNSEVQLEVSVYHAMIEGYVSRGDLERAEGLVQELIERTGTSPTLETYSFLIECYSKYGHIVRAEALLMDYQRRPIANKVVTGTIAPPRNETQAPYRMVIALINGFLAEENPLEAVRVVFMYARPSTAPLVPREGWPVPTGVCNSILTSLVSHAQTRAAQSLFGGMVECEAIVNSMAESGPGPQGWLGSPDQTTLIIMMRSYVAVNDADSAVKTFQQIMSKRYLGQASDPGVYLELIEMLVRTHRYKDAGRVVQWLRTVMGVTKASNYAAGIEKVLKGQDPGKRTKDVIAIVETKQEITANQISGGLGELINANADRFEDMLLVLLSDALTMRPQKDTPATLMGTSPMNKIEGSESSSEMSAEAVQNLSLDIYKLLMRHGTGRLRAETYKRMMQLHQKRGDFGSVVKVYTTYGQGLKQDSDEGQGVDPEVVEILIETCLESGGPRSAQAVSQMHASDAFELAPPGVTSDSDESKTHGVTQGRRRLTMRSYEALVGLQLLHLLTDRIVPTVMEMRDAGYTLGAKSIMKWKLVARKNKDRGTRDAAVKVLDDFLEEIAPEVYEEGERLVRQEDERVARERSEGAKDRDSVRSRLLRLMPDAGSRAGGGNAGLRLRRPKVESPSSVKQNPELAIEHDDVE